MFIPLVDSLRCPNAHEETWLVASIDRAEERDIKEGTLGCPTCLAEYPIRDGIVWFRERETPGRSSSPLPDEARAVKLAAALDLTDPRMTALLQGAWGAQAPLVASYAPATLLLLDPPGSLVSGDGISIIMSDLAPVAAASMHAAALDASAGDALVASVVRTLRPAGRLLAPVSLSLPPGCVELARDDEVWVARLADMATVSAPIAIGRRAGRPA